MKKTKTTNNSKSVNKRAAIGNSECKKVPIVFDEYMDMFLMQKKPVTDTFLDMLAETYILWVKTEIKCIIFTEFLQQQGITRSHFYRWLLRSEKLREAHDFVLMTLGNRRERGVAERKYEPSMITKVHGHYSDIWVTELTRIAALNNKEDNSKQNITVLIEPFGEKE